MKENKIIIGWLFGIMPLLIRLTFLDTYRRLTIWLIVGSGGTGETPSHY